MRQLTNANTPEQNGVAERANRKLLEVARSMTVTIATPHFLWTKSINTAAFLLNRSPAIANPKVTPFQRLFSKILDISFLRIFGSKVYVWIEKDQREKLEAKAKPGLFVGYDELTKGFCIWVPSDRKLIISRNVRFDESSVLNSTQIQPPLFTIPIVTGTSSLQPSNFDLTDQPIAASTPTPPSLLPQIPQNLPNIESTDCQNSTTQFTSSTTQSNPYRPSNNIPFDHLPAPKINT